MAEIVGKIVLAQEGRFKLVTAAGQTKLFLLAPDAPQEPQDLANIVGLGDVLVEFSSIPRRVAGLAHRIERVRQ